MLLYLSETLGRDGNVFKGVWDVTSKIGKSNREFPSLPLFVAMRKATFLRPKNTGARSVHCGPKHLYFGTAVLVQTWSGWVWEQMSVFRGGLRLVLSSFSAFGLQFSEGVELIVTVRHHPAAPLRGCGRSHIQGTSQDSPPTKVPI